MPEPLDDLELELSAAGRRDRAAGLLLGAALADSWSTSTEIALCVADAAATGRPLTDREVVGLVSRNLTLLCQERGPVDTTKTTDALLAATAVVALAHVYDGPEQRARATTAIVAEIDAGANADRLVLWVDLVAETLRSGAVPNVLPLSTDASAVVAVVRAAERVSVFAGDQLATGLATISMLPAASGALLGARFGQHAFSRANVSALSGWPGAGAAELAGLGLLALRGAGRMIPDVESEIKGSPVPIERWGETDHGAAHRPRTPIAEQSTTTSWRQSHITLTPADAEVSNA